MNRTLFLLALLVLVACRPTLSGDDDDAVDDDDATDDDDAVDDDDATDDDDLADDDDATPPDPIEPMPVPEVLIDRVFVVPLSAGEWIEPAGLSLLMQDGTFGSMPLRLSVRAESGFEPEEQPGLHFISGPGAEDDPCVPNLSLTAGADGQYGTGDDAPGMFWNPTFEASAPRIEALGDEGLAIPIGEATLIGRFRDDGEFLYDFELSGAWDTRPVAEVLDPGGDPGAFCDFLMETVGISCEACPGPLEPGDFCLIVEVTDLVGELFDWEATIPERSCADVIVSSVEAGECSAQAAAWDVDGDGVYEGCPEYSP